jgi:hypothetical protein
MTNAVLGRIVPVSRTWDLAADIAQSRLWAVIIGLYTRGRRSAIRVYDLVRLAIYMFLVL